VPTGPTLAAIAPSDGYEELLRRLKHEIASARTRAALAVNEELIRLYWRLGAEIVARQERDGWGAQTIKRLAADLRREFPGMTGLSERNLKYMRQLAKIWPDSQIGPQAVAQLPWGHIRCLLDKLAGDAPALAWYAQRAVEGGWSRPVLEHHLATDRHAREGRALTNFADTLPAAEGRLVQQILHEDYNLQFLDVAAAIRERDLERALVDDVERFMLELGVGFAFVGRQVRLEVDGEEFILDLLFFHVVLNRYVVIELKLGKFRPQYAGQLNFYVNLVDDRLRRSHHARTIGLILCASRNETVVRYALQGMEGPLGVARYSGRQPPAGEIEAGLGGHLPPPEELSAGVQQILARRSPAPEEPERLPCP
jgi:predicted nuclease of restriction endonuclease-like (RecB) superfamily